MRNDVAHILVGYDPKTELAVYRGLLPTAIMARILPMVGPDPEDPDAIDSYPVELHIVNDIFGLLKRPKGDQKLEYFLECVSTELTE